jgi:manganese oxidase
MRSSRQASVSLILVVVLVVSGLAAISGGLVWASDRAAPAPYVGVVRNYYIAANEVEWNYTPSGMDEISGEPLGVANTGQLQYTTRNATYLGTSFLKCIYQQYTNGTFTTMVPQPTWLGIMGPTMFAVVGDTIQVTFKNNCRFPESVHPHGVFYNRTSEGAVYNTSAPYYTGEAVPTGQEWVYDWMVPARAGPGPDDGEAVMWMYHSHVYEPVDVNDGLIGSIIISAPGDANPDGTPKGYGMVVPLLFNIFDETQSQYETYNVDHNALNGSAVNATGIDGCLGLGVDQTCVADPTWALWAESMRKYTINGYLYGNLPMITIPQGTQVLWCLMGMGGDFHSPAWDGNDLEVGGMSQDVVPLVPAEMVDGTMWANNTGTWLIESLTQEDLNGGMTARYTVVPSPSPAVAPTGGVLGVPTSSARTSAAPTSPGPVPSVVAWEGVAPLGSLVAPRWPL